MNGNPYIDSYISTDPAYSTNGKYDPAKRRDQAGVASVSSLTPAIDTGGGEIYGTAATGPGGTVTGDVGDGTWLSTSSGQQPGHVSDDFNMAIPDVALPVPWAPNFTPLLNQKVNGVTILVQGKVRIYFNGDFKMTGSTAVTLASNATLEIYMGGAMDLSGQCVINPSGITGNCTIYGLPTCRSMKYAGTAEAFARMYAPQAAVEIAGTFDFSGSIVAESLKFSGTCNIHYDEALHSGVPQFRVVSWEEL
jgi:hypothetical protein